MKGNFFLYNYKIFLVLIIILLFAGFVRVYKITGNPPSLSWDEAAVGYNAWTIANYGRDERGNFFPAYFISFLDDKHPVHVYLTAIFVSILDLSEFSTRFPSAFFGILNVLVIFFLARVVFKNNLVGLIASFLLAISPYDIHFSRFNHELNFALFFFLLGLYLFFKGIEKKNYLLSLSLVSFGVSFISYHSGKVVIPLVLISLAIVYFKKLMEVKKNLYLGVFFILLFIIFLFLNTPLLGISRAKQTAVSSGDIKETFIFKQTQNLKLGGVSLIAEKYFSFFSPRYLFINGDKNPRLSAQVLGEVFILDLPFVLIGVFSVVKSKNKQGLIILLVSSVAPLAGSFSGESPHAARGMFFLGGFQIVTAYGIFKTVNFFKRRTRIFFLLTIILSLYLILFGFFYFKYFSEYKDRYAIEWQYGMKQVVEYVKGHPEYKEVYITNIRSQPYIFFLFYTKKPLEEYVREVEYNNSKSRSFSLVSSFDRYFFEYWDPIEALPDPNKLYIVTSSQYDGLRHKNDFAIKKIVYFPDGSIAFYLIAK